MGGLGARAGGVIPSRISAVKNARASPVETRLSHRGALQGPFSAVRILTRLKEWAVITQSESILGLWSPFRVQTRKVYNQNMMVAASAIAEKKTFGHLSEGVTIRRQSLTQLNVISIRVRRL